MKELVLDLHALKPMTADLEGCHIVPWIQFQCNCSLTGDWQPHPQPEWTLTVNIWIIIIKKTLEKQSITTIPTSLPIRSKQCTQHVTSKTNCRKIFKRHRNQGVNIMGNDTRRQNCVQKLSFHRVNETAGRNPHCCPLPLTRTHPVVLCKVCKLPFPSLLALFHW